MNFESGKRWSPVARLAWQNWGTRQNRRVSYLDLKREISQWCKEVLLVINAAGFVPLFREKNVFLHWLLNIRNE